MKQAERTVLKLLINKTTKEEKTMDMDTLGYFIFMDEQEKKAQQQEDGDDEDEED